jgi:hypothetical protein
LCRPVEIDDDVAAEDDFRPFGHAEIGVHSGSRLRMKYFRRRSWGTGLAPSDLKIPMAALASTAVQMSVASTLNRKPARSREYSLRTMARV